MIRATGISAHELTLGEARLDGFYYASGGRAVRLALESAGIPLQRLDEAAQPPFMGQRFARCYVQDPRFGVPFLGPSEMRLADLDRLPLVSRERTPNLKQLQIRRGWILLSRSGVVGNIAYVREDMDGLVGSDDLIRIIPRVDGPRGGYLYAFLCSVSASAMLRRSTYGGVIPHIEPQHIADLPIPRLDSSIELAIHERIEQAAAKRVEAQEQLAISKRFLREITGVPTTFSVSYDHAYAVGSVPIAELEVGTNRLDAYHYVGHAGGIRGWRSPRFPMWPLGKLTARIFNPPIFKRIRVVDGVPYLLGAEVYEAHPRPATKIARGTPNLNDYILQRDMIVFEDAGQRYGLLGTPVYVGRTLAGCAATNNMTRIVFRSREDAAYLFALLSSDYGRRLVLRHSYGTSLPHILPDHIADVAVPWPEHAQRAVIAEPILKAVELRDEANDLEDEAQDILSRALAEALPVPAPSPDGHGGG